jgi:hypothetical protein
MSRKMIPIDKIKENPRNPRTISQAPFDDLVRSLTESPAFMEMKPILVDENWMVLAGNMRRLGLIHLDYTKIPQKWVNVFTREIAKEIQDERKKLGKEIPTYEELCDELTIKDNLHAGDWDTGKLKSNDWEDEKLADWGLEHEKKVDKAKDGDVIEFEQSVQIEPPREYIVIIAEPNSKEWEEMKQMLKLKQVRRGGYKKGSPFDAHSLERVLNWKELKKRLKC